MYVFTSVSGWQKTHYFVATVKLRAKLMNWFIYSACFFTIVEENFEMWPCEMVQNVTILIVLTYQDVFWR